MTRAFLLCLCFFVCCSSVPYFVIKCVGNCDYDAHVNPTGGAGLFGGEMYDGVATPSDLHSYAWLLAGADHGDVVVLTASGGCVDDWDTYNEFIYSKVDTKSPSSVTTVCFTSRDASYNETVLGTLRKAEMIFLSGGDQSNYYNFWHDTPVAAIINDRVNNHYTVLGGSSAGLAVQGEYIYSALNASETGELTGAEALDDPYVSTLTISKGLFSLPFMKNVITDTHFMKRDRMGRLVAFVSRIVVDHGEHRMHGIGINEHTALLLSPNGTAVVNGPGPVDVLTLAHTPSVCAPGHALSVTSVSALHLSGGMAYDFTSFSSSDGHSYTLSSTSGLLRSQGNDGQIY